MNEDACRQVYIEVKLAYPCASKFEHILRVCIAESFRTAHLNQVSVVALIDHIKQDLNEAWTESELICRAVFIYVLLRRQQSSHICLSRVCDFLAIYPEFRRLESEELERLLRFRNAVVVAASIYDPREIWFTSLVLNHYQLPALGSGPSHVGAETCTTLIIQRETAYFGFEHPSTRVATSSGSAKHKYVQIEDEQTVATRKQRADAEKKAQARACAAKSFWNNLGAQMETGEDIPGVDAAPGDTFLSVVYMSHDLLVSEIGEEALSSEWQFPGFFHTSTSHAFDSLERCAPHQTPPPASNVIPPWY